ncbi:putative lipoprotein [Minicystis rosea]|nr:putative lipoprotein [Minicystis rosea]
MRIETSSAPRSTTDSDPSLRRAERRLRHAFTAILAALAPAMAAQACSDPAPMDGPPDAGPSPEASTEDAATADADAGSDALPDLDATSEDAPGKDCMMKITVFDSGIPGEPGCIYELPCGLSQGLTVVGCALYSTPNIPLGCTVQEGYGCLADAFAPGPEGEVHILCPECLGGGRRPQGLVRPRAIDARSATGAYFARMSHAEAASVHAFARLGDELAAHDAPAALVRAAARSARDEVRHARAMARLAHARGTAIPQVRVRRGAPRSLAAIARENAVEGCIHEAFGALLVAYQAAHAPDEAMRRTFARIAADEARHAALSWAVSSWIEDRLTPRERARVAAARARAVRALRRCVPATTVDTAVGRPSPHVHAELVQRFIDRLGLA